MGAFLMPIDPSTITWESPDPSTIKWDDEVKAAPKWTDLPRNVIPSAGRFVGGIAQTVMHPVDTVGSLGDALAGALRNVTPKSLRELIDKADSTPENQLRASATADSVGQFYKDRYGGAENVKNTLITDPVGAAADLSSVLGIGGLSTTGTTSNVLSKASKFTNPLSVVPPLARVSGAAFKHATGMMSGVGPENVSQAFKAGYTGPRQSTAFIDNLTGKSNITDVLDAAKQGIENMGRAKAAEYRANMSAVRKDSTVLKFDGIDKALSDAEAVTTFKGQITNDRAAAAVAQINKDVQWWKTLPENEFHTPEGLDALKQKVGGVLESIPFEEKTARLAAGKVYHAIKSEIVKQAPVYAETMKTYSESSDLIREIERALSLGQKSAADTAMRKLQSLSRNNVNTNYGSRLNLAKTLEQQGGVDILPSIAGQAMVTWTPRGLPGQLGGMMTAGSALLSNPIAATALPFQSPRALGLMSYGAGRAGGVLGRGAGAMGLTPDNAGLLGLTAYELGQPGLLGQ
jgi:hypothetical protein